MRPLVTIHILLESVWQLESNGEDVQDKFIDLHHKKSSTNAGCAHRPGNANPRARVSSMHHLVHDSQHTKDINDDIPALISYTHYDINDNILNNVLFIVQPLSSYILWTYLVSFYHWNDKLIWRGKSLCMWVIHLFLPPFIFLAICAIVACSEIFNYVIK